MTRDEFESILEEAFMEGYNNAYEEVEEAINEAYEEDDYIDIEGIDEDAHPRHINRQFPLGGMFMKGDRNIKDIKRLQHELKKLRSKDVNTLNDDPNAKKIYDKWIQKRNKHNTSDMIHNYIKQANFNNKNLKSLKERILWNSDRAKYDNFGNKSIEDRMNKYYHRKS